MELIQMIELPLQRSIKFAKKAGKKLFIWFNCDGAGTHPKPEKTIDLRHAGWCALTSVGEKTIITYKLEKHPYRQTSS